jgi:hypothetical protein
MIVYHPMEIVITPHTTYLLIDHIRKLCDLAHPDSSCHGCQSIFGTTMRSSTTASLAMLYVELAIVVTLTLINGLLAMAELAVISSRRARLQALVARDVVGSRRALALASNPGKFLSTVQIGITLIGVLSGAFSRHRTMCLNARQVFYEGGADTRQPACRRRAPHTFGAVCRIRQHDASGLARRVRQIDCRRNREVGQGDPGGQHQAGVSRADAKTQAGGVMNQAAGAVQDADGRTVDAAAEGAQSVKDVAVAGHDVLKKFVEARHHPLRA